MFPGIGEYAFTGAVGMPTLLSSPCDATKSAGQLLQFGVSGVFHEAMSNTRDEVSEDGSDSASPSSDGVAAEVRYRLAAHTVLPEQLEHLAWALRQTLEEIEHDAPAAELRAAATRLVAQVEYCHNICRRLTVFAGELRGLAWAADAQDVGSGDELRSSSADT